MFVRANAESRNAFKRLGSMERDSIAPSDECFAKPLLVTDTEALAFVVEPVSSGCGSRPLKFTRPESVSPPGVL